MLACPCLSGSQNISVSVSRGAGWLPGYPRPWKHAGHAELVTGSNFPCFWWFVVGDIRLSQRRTFAETYSPIHPWFCALGFLVLNPCHQSFPRGSWVPCAYRLPFPGQQGGCRCTAIALGSGLVGVRPQESRATLQMSIYHSSGDSVFCVDVCVLCPWRRPP